MTDRETVFGDMAILIPVRSDPRILDCIESIDIKGVELVIALNDPTAEIRMICERLESATIVVVAEPGIGGALAAAVEATKRRYLVLTDSDCLFDRGALGHLADALVSGAEIARGDVIYDTGNSWTGRLIAEARRSNHDGRVNGYSPLLVIDRRVIPAIGGYLFSSGLPFREDRELDFRLQLAGKVVVPTKASVRHAPQHGVVDLRSAFRYGRGERIGRRMGLFAKPSWSWVIRDAGRTLVWYARECSWSVTAYLGVWTSIFWCGLLLPVAGERRQPRAPFRVAEGVPMWSTELPAKYAIALRHQHATMGRTIGSDSGQ